MTYLNIYTMIIMTYSFPTDLSSILRVGIVGFTSATHGHILGVGVVDMGCRLWAIGITHGLLYAMPGTSSFDSPWKAAMQANPSG